MGKNKYVKSFINLLSDKRFQLFLFILIVACFAEPASMIKMKSNVKTVVSDYIQPMSKYIGYPLLVVKVFLGFTAEQGQKKPHFIQAAWICVGILILGYMPELFKSATDVDMTT